MNICEYKLSGVSLYHTNPKKAKQMKTTEDYTEFYLLKNRRVLYITECYITGMAGEPMVAVYLTVNGKNVNFDAVKDQMNDGDRAELKSFLFNVGRVNNASAINFCK